SNEIIGSDFGLKGVMDLVSEVAPLDSPVLLAGETGVGKELIAGAIHTLSKRNKGPYIRVNCGAIPDSLIESELFGHEKGAFTGATEKKIGRLEVANGGTVFLDEIGDMSLKAQSKTLRILQEQKFERVGGTKTIEVDVRVIAATNKDLEKEIENGAFRDDLYFRLNVIPMRVPSLKERVEDIPSLVREFVREFALSAKVEPKEFPPETIDLLQKYDWPGNVRELKNLIERLMIMTQGSVIGKKDIPAPFNQSAKNMRVTMESGFSSDSLKE
ncbi:MAG: sigma-54-dependent Fis family transcriptional regulator, partial [Deltaproteobacteria bacterium]|nr:sigma-54-dependent Fis family transcriptional regulator [Deltaproteobacteria bacterium]